ncbi:tetratricopeptide repeat protein [Heyndrickxia acidicola]|uniref:Tetratricopeptide repeat protein n=1 Tax=Heyndrickxia acidicola TaxID=209389 RepID=A0ABU6MKC2_9BACI|nr:tetratricopeptide repeat protein [Heyndrickxia acidicola]MED1204832.1 tetratricopeptide repeat protein [Heyndrickxia acidicola]
MKDNRKTGKVIHFPGLKERLMAIGIERLEEKKYTDAVELLSQAKELDRDDAEVGMAYLVALYEAGDYEKAKQQGEELLHKGIGDYFEIFDIFIMILIQLGEHKAVKDTITALFEEREVPADRMEHYEKLLQFSQKRIPQKEEKKDFPNTEDLQPTSILRNLEVKEQVFRAAQLNYENIYPYMAELREFLENPHNHPFVKSMVVNVLKEHGVERPAFIRKFTFEEQVVPSELPAVFETPFYLEFIEYLRKEVEDKNPTLYQQIKIVVDRHFFILYPFEPIPMSAPVWAAAYFLFVQEMYQDGIDPEITAQQFGVDRETLEKALRWIDEIEEISLPIV